MGEREGGLMIYVAVFLATFLNIGLRATQQRQVMAAQYWRMPPVSMGMAFCEVFVWGNVARAALQGGTWQLVGVALAMGCGGALGSIAGTYLHARKRG